MRELSKQLKALGNERRLKILVLLRRSNFWTMTDIAESIKLSFRSTSKHLQVLKHAGFIEGEQSGSYIYYRLCKDHPVYKCLSDFIK